MAYLRVKYGSASGNTPPAKTAAGGEVRWEVAMSLSPAEGGQQGVFVECWGCVWEGGDVLLGRAWVRVAGRARHGEEGDEAEDVSCKLSTFVCMHIYISKMCISTRQCIRCKFSADFYSRPQTGGPPFQAAETDADR